MFRGNRRKALAALESYEGVGWLHGWFSEGGRGFSVVRGIVQ
jgi:hypothetical protein